MSGYAMDAGECVAAALITLRTAARKDHDWETIFAAVPQHFCAALGSRVDDAWIYALENHGKDGTR